MKADRPLTRQIVVRIDEELHNALTVDADKNGRTVAQSVRFILRATTSPPCWCHACAPSGPFALGTSVMVICPECGNKRCPHAADHRFDCTGSNEPGQPGSAYP